MRLVPESNAGKIEFFKTRVTPWGEHAAELGVAPAAAAELQALTEAAREALIAQQAAQNAAQSATLRLNMAIDAMATAGANIIQQIRTTASQAGDGVYPLALIPAPADPSPVAAPGKPHTFDVELSQIGSVTLTWKCKNPRGSVGTMYQVSRRLGPGGAFQFLAAVGEKKFEDTTIPPGSASLTYRIQAVRSRAAGPEATFNVNFGGGGAMPTSFVIPAAPGKPVCVAA